MHAKEKSVRWVGKERRNAVLWDRLSGKGRQGKKTPSDFCEKTRKSKSKFTEKSNFESAKPGLQKRKSQRIEISAGAGGKGKTKMQKFQQKPKGSLDFSETALYNKKRFAWRITGKKPLSPGKAPESFAKGNVVRGGRRGRKYSKMKYDVIIIGAGPGGIFSAYELTKKAPALKIAVFEAGHPLERRHCPIDGNKVKTCIGCKTCSIMSGFGGAGAFSDGKYNITNDFGGTLHEHIGKKPALELMRYVDEINMQYGGEGTRLYSTAGSQFKKICIQNKLNLLDASVRHLGTDVNFVVLQNLYDYLKSRVDFFFNTPVHEIRAKQDGYTILTDKGDYACRDCIVSVGRSGSKWMEKVCRELGIHTRSNRVDIGVRVELPAVVFSHLTDELYESKIVYRTEKFEDNVRTFCMNPHGIVVNENTNGIVTVNGHSYEDPSMQTENTNFALLVSKHFSEPFEDSNGYGESIARLSNMLGGGVIVQRLGDLVRGRRSNAKRIEEALVVPTLAATPGDLSLVLPKRILDGIIEMIYALDKIAPGTANDDTLLYGVEVKFYNMEVEMSGNLETKYKGLYMIGDGSGITHSLSHASASGVFVARRIAEAFGAEA